MNFTTNVIRKIIILKYSKNGVDNLNKSKLFIKIEISTLVYIIIRMNDFMFIYICIINITGVRLFLNRHFAIFKIHLTGFY